MFERQPSLSEGCDDIGSVIYDEYPNVNIAAVRDDAALPEPAYRERGSVAFMHCWAVKLQIINTLKAISVHNKQ